MADPIDWSLLKTPDFLGGAMNAYAAGRTMAREQGVQRALQGALTDPTTAMQGVLAYGDLPTASALSALTYQQAQRQMLQRGMADVFGGGEGAPSTAPPAPAPAQGAPDAAVAPAPDTTPQNPTAADFAALPPAQLAHASMVLDTFDRVGLQLQQLPYAQRQAALAAERPALVQAGVPAQMIDSFDPTDGNIQEVHENIAATRRMMPGGAATMQAPTSADANANAPVPAAAGAPPPPASPTPLTQAKLINGQWVEVPTAPGPLRAGPPDANASAPAPTNAPAAPPPPPLITAASPGATNLPSTASAPVGGAPAASAPAANPQAAGGLNLTDPRTQRGLEMMAFGGANIDPLVALGTATMPQYDTTRSGLVFNKRTGKFVNAGPNDQGIVPVVDASGNVTGARELPGFDAALANQAEARSEGEGKGKLTYAQAIAQAESGGHAAGELPYAGALSQAESGGHAAGEAPYQVVEIPNSDGSTTKGVLRVVNGQTTFTPIQPGAGAVAGPGGPDSSNGVAAPAFNQSQPTNEHTFAEHDAAAYSETLSKEASPEIQTHLQIAVATAQQAVHAAMAIDPNLWTPQAKAVADFGNALHSLTGLPFDTKKANDLNYYSALIPQVTRGSFATFPRLEKEFELVKDAIPSLKTPRDAAALTFATIAATNQRNLDFAQFANSYNGPHSEAALNRAWQTSPLGSRSVFADPIFRQLTIDGKPAVYIPRTPVNGHLWGIFRPGTPNAQPFLVQ